MSESALKRVDVPDGKLGVMLKDGESMGNIITVTKVLNDSPMLGKLFSGDRIMGFNGQMVATINDLIPLVTNQGPGKERYLEIKRAKQNEEEKEEAMQNGESKKEETIDTHNLESKQKDPGDSDITERPASGQKDCGDVNMTEEAESKEKDSGDSDNTERPESGQMDGEDVYMTEEPKSKEKDSGDADVPDSSKDNKQQEVRDIISNIIVPPGHLGVRLDRNHKVLEVLPSSPLLNKIFPDDRIATLNGNDVTDLKSKELVAMLAKFVDGGRVLGVIKKDLLPPQPREITVPPVDRIGMVLRDNEKESHIDVVDLLPDSILRGKVFPGDIVIGVNGIDVSKIEELMPYMRDKSKRVIKVVNSEVRFFRKKRKAPPPSAETEPAKKKTKQSNSTSVQQAAMQTSHSPLPVSPLDSESDPPQSESAVASYAKTVAEERFISVIAPPGKLGIKLNKNHEVIDILSTSALAGKVMIGDRLINIDEVDVRAKDSSSLIVLLMSSQNRTRVLGIRRQTGKHVEVPYRMATISPNGSRLSELESMFPNLKRMGIPMGENEADTSMRCKVLSELIAFHESVGLANDVETPNGSFCHLVKIPKKGLSKREELASSLEDVLASLSLIRGSENDATDLLLEFLAKRNPGSYTKFCHLAEEHPVKKRKIEESKRDPDLSRSAKSGVNNSGKEQEEASKSKDEISTIDMQLLDM